MKFMIFVIICFYSLSNHITNGKNLCSGNNNLKIERLYGLGDHWAIGYQWYYTMYQISISGIDDGNCKLTIKKGNENETFVIKKSYGWQKKKYFRIYQPKINSGDDLEIFFKASKDLDESYDNFSIYLNCRKEKCQVENIRVKNCSENGNYPNDQFKITYDKRSYGGNGNASCISGMLYFFRDLIENQLISVTCEASATWTSLEYYECWKDSENVTVEGNLVLKVNETLNLTCDFIEGFPRITIIEFIFKHINSSTLSIKSAGNKTLTKTVTFDEKEYKYVRCEISYNYKNQNKKFSSEWKPLNIQYTNISTTKPPTNKQNFNNTSNKQFNCYNSLMALISAVITEIISLIGF